MGDYEPQFKAEKTELEIVRQRIYEEPTPATAVDSQLLPRISSGNLILKPVFAKRGSNRRLSTPAASRHDEKTETNTLPKLEPKSMQKSATLESQKPEKPVFLKPILHQQVEGSSSEPIETVSIDHLLYQVGSPKEGKPVSMDSILNNVESEHIIDASKSPKLSLEPAVSTTSKKSLHPRRKFVPPKRKNDVKADTSLKPYWLTGFDQFCDWICNGKEDDISMAVNSLLFSEEVLKKESFWIEF